MVPREIFEALKKHISLILSLFFLFVGVVFCCFVLCCQNQLMIQGSKQKDHKNTITTP